MHGYNYASYYGKVSIETARHTTMVGTRGRVDVLQRWRAEEQNTPRVELKVHFCARNCMQGKFLPWLRNLYVRVEEKVFWHELRGTRDSNGGGLLCVETRQ